MRRMAASAHSLPKNRVYCRRRRKIKEALVTLFENDESSARPAGSMEVLDVVWFTHNSKSGQYSSAKVHRSVSVNVDGTVAVNGSSIPDLRYEVIEGR